MLRVVTTVWEYDTLEVDKLFSMTSPFFRERVLTVVKAIPKGSVMTYGEVAKAAGTPHAARAVGSLMKGNLNPEVPCHRVVRSDGGIGYYNRAGGGKTKWKRLEEEGVDMSKLRLSQY